MMTPAAHVVATPAEVSDALARAKCEPKQLRDGRTGARCPICGTGHALNVRRGEHHGAVIMCAKGCAGGDVATRLGLEPCAENSNPEPGRPTPTLPRVPSPVHPTGGDGKEGRGSNSREGPGRPGRLGESLREYLKRTENLPEATYLIPGLVPDVGQVWIIAAPGSCKTWFAFTCVKSAAAADRDVFLIEEEHSEKGLRDRFISMAFPEEALDRVRVCHRIGLKVGDKKFATLLREVATAARPVVMLDCFAQVFSGKENEADDAQRFNDHIKRIVQANAAALVLVLHHTSKGSERAEGAIAYAGRGSSALNGAADVELRLRKLSTEKGSGLIRFTVENPKAREAEEAAPVRVTITLGTGDATFESGEKPTADRSERVLEVLRESDKPLTKDAVSKLAKKRRDDTGKIIDELVAQRKVRREGSGFVLARTMRPTVDSSMEAADA